MPTSKVCSEGDISGDKSSQGNSEGEPDDILNDWNTDVDHLGHVVYAKALARYIQRIKTPMTVGIFARWGSGKSFLVKHVQSLVGMEQEQNNSKENTTKWKINKTFVVILASLLILAAFVACLVLTIVFKSTVTSSVITFRVIFWAVSVLLLFIIFIIILLSLGKEGPGFIYQFKWVFLTAFFTKLPIEKAEAIGTTEKFHLKQQQHWKGNESGRSNSEGESTAKGFVNSRRYVFVNFNAWEYAGSDRLWAGIVTTLAEKIEEEFGILTTRLFRTINLETICSERGSKELLVKVSSENAAEKLQSLMLPYGLLDIKKRKGPSKGLICNMEFSNPRAAENALKDLTQFNIEAKYADAMTKIAEKQKTNLWKHFQRFPRRTCGLPNWVWCALFAVGCIVVPITTYLSIFLVEGSLVEFASGNGSISDVIGEVLSVLPLAMIVIFIFLKLCWALVSSQKRRILSALKGAEGNVANELGFMNRIKEEVEAITSLIHTVKLTTNIEYKVVITIDDLDRVPLAKVKAVLEAVNILLSDRNSPFICLIAIDMRIAVKCFEYRERGERISIVNGYEYLKKIINVPFCMPEIDDAELKSKFIFGLINEALRTKEAFDSHFSYNPRSAGTNVKNFPKDSWQEALKYHDVTDASSTEVARRSELELDKFLSYCRRFMHENEVVKNHLYGNPRNIKRIFNIVSITASVIQCHYERVEHCNNWVRYMTDEGDNPGILKYLSSQNYLTEKLAKDLVLWIIISDQWPFRVRYILQVIEDSDQRSKIKGRESEYIKPDCKIARIYQDHVIVNYLGKSLDDVDEDLMKLDYDPDVLENLLWESKLTKQRVKELLRFSINLNRNLKQAISFHTDRMDMTQLRTTPPKEDAGLLLIKEATNGISNV